MAHIVILGAGIGGMPCAIEMRDMLPKQHRITVVNALDYFQFVPSNPWLAVGWRKREDVVLPIAPMLERKGVAFVPGTPFFCANPDHATFRLSFATADADKIREGVARLGQAL